MGGRSTSTDELTCVGRQLFGNAYTRTYPFAKNPRLNSGECCIVNTMGKSPGEHWFALICEDGDILGYDSFGRTLLQHVKFTDDDVEQHYLEHNCGQRSLAWLCVAKYHGIHLAELI